MELIEEKSETELLNIVRKHHLLKKVFDIYFFRKN
jgi:hypothetical protein